ncbi:MAG: hypothetical protein LBE27_00965 [Deltaproteobacteria bacterium]|jgi:hypothetical protein|nr:hypothetical protein [Deltaproteobacteria bacterium]
MGIFKKREGFSIFGYMSSFSYIIIAILIYFFTSAGLIWSIFWPIWLIVQLYHLLFG